MYMGLKTDLIVKKIIKPYVMTLRHTRDVVLAPVFSFICDLCSQGSKGVMDNDDDAHTSLDSTLQHGVVCITPGPFFFINQFDNVERKRKKKLQLWHY